MANLLSTKELVHDINGFSKEITGDLYDDGKPTGLCIIRLGENPSDMAYEKTIIKQAEAAGIDIISKELPADIEEDELIEIIEDINDDENIDGMMIFRPLPKHIDEDMLKEVLISLKDIDGISASSMAMLYDTPVEFREEMEPSWLGSGFPPCTAEACILILDSYGIEIAGKKAVVVGRSNVIGKPVSLMLLNRDATVTTCHTGTRDLKSITKDADILIVATGKAESIDAEYVSPGQTVIDVGIHVRDDGSLCGDVKFDDVADIVENITPVPGGVGGLTTALLIKHVVDASMRILIIENEMEIMETEDHSRIDVGGKVIKLNLPDDQDDE